MDPDAVEHLTVTWLAAWNDHDLDGVLAHFADDAVFTSPVAAMLLPETGGVLRGKEAIRAYWTMGLERFPHRQFTLEGVYAGVDTVVINFRNHVGAQVCEVLRFEHGLVVRGDGTYLAREAFEEGPDQPSIS